MPGRPVISSDIGGMAEEGTDGFNGLHSGERPRSVWLLQSDGRPRLLGLWAQLRAGIPKIYRVEDQVGALANLHSSLLTRTIENR